MERCGLGRCAFMTSVPENMRRHRVFFGEYGGVCVNLGHGKLKERKERKVQDYEDAVDREKEEKLRGAKRKNEEIEATGDGADRAVKVEKSSRVIRRPDGIDFDVSKVCRHIDKLVKRGPEINEVGRLPIGTKLTVTWEGEGSFLCVLVAAPPGPSRSGLQVVSVDNSFPDPVDFDPEEDEWVMTMHARPSTIASSPPLLTGSESEEGRGDGNPGMTRNLFDEGIGDDDGDDDLFGAFAPGKRLVVNVQTSEERGVGIQLSK